MEKSPDAFRTISEVADWLGVQTHVLRFWESRFAQVKPVKRAGGRRYYRPGDMALIGGIKRLLHDDGMTIRGVQKLLREAGVRHVQSLSPPLGAERETIEGTALRLGDEPGREVPRTSLRREEMADDADNGEDAQDALFAAGEQADDGAAVLPARVASAAAAAAGKAPPAADDAWEDDDAETGDTSETEAAPVAAFGSVRRDPELPFLRPRKEAASAPTATEPAARPEEPKPPAPILADVPATDPSDASEAHEVGAGAVARLYATDRARLCADPEALRRTVAALRELREENAL